MFFASLDMAIFVMGLCVWKEPIGVSIGYGLWFGLLVLMSLGVCRLMAERTRWRERKFNERRITFKPTIVLAATVFCLVQVLRFVLYAVQT